MSRLWIATLSWWRAWRKLMWPTSETKTNMCQFTLAPTKRTGAEVVVGILVGADLAGGGAPGALEVRLDDVAVVRP